MANRKICDRCKEVIPSGSDFLSMRRWQLPRFLGIITGKRRKDLWTDMAGSLDLCAECTHEFFNFVKGGQNGKESKQPDAGNADEHIPQREGKLPGSS